MADTIDRTTQIASLDYVVRIGAGPISPADDAHELSGFDLIGPMTKADAEAYVKEVREVFNGVGNTRFIYGHPIAEVRRILRPAYLTGHRAGHTTADAVASNWYLPKGAKVPK